jgi:hypothetical protein
MNTDKHNNIEPSGELAASIRDFRSAVTHVAERETARPVAASWLAPARKRRRSHQQRIVLGLAFAALLFLATLPWLSHSRPAATQPAIQATAAAAPANDSDTALLEQVDADVSESVPSSLAPLAELDSWNSASTNTSNGSSAARTTQRPTETTNAAH